MMHRLSCRLCGAEISSIFVDLGTSPLPNAFLKAEELHRAEASFPLTVYLCDRCKLVQLPECERPDTMFSNYAYYSSYSDSWLAHAEHYTMMMIERFGFDRSSLVIELASNDGYLLQYFVREGIPVLGVEPAANVAEAAMNKGIPTVVKFFGVETAKAMVEESKRADLVLGNNVLAHVPDLHDFIEGIGIVLKAQGVITLEFPSLMRLMEHSQFDTMYHEHLSYFSFLTAERAFAAHALTLFDVEELSTHGGSLRIYGRHADNNSLPITARVMDLKQREIAGGADDLEFYQDFGVQVEASKRALLGFLLTAKREGKSVVGYGAPAKGNTLLNYCGVRADLLAYTVDRSPHKQGRFLPGTHIPIYAPEAIAETKPDYVLILPWNIKDEIVSQMAHIRDWGGRFVVPIPKVEVIA